MSCYFGMARPNQALRGGTSSCQREVVMNAHAVTIREIVARKFDLSVEEISEETSLIHDLSANSLDKIELIMLLEQEFDVEIMDAEAEEIITVGDAEAVVKRALSAED